tara:strand:+ start:130 stop:900 length:771 start_codon:yes stop_codon:yes gene_type:complete
MKLTKDYLKKIIKEEVANIKERTAKPVRRRGTNVAGVGRGESEIDWYATDQAQKDQDKRDDADAADFRKRSNIAKDKADKASKERKSKMSRARQQRLYKYISPEVKKGIGNISKLLSQARPDSKVAGFLGPNPMQFMGRGIAQAYIDNYGNDDVENAILRLGSAESLDEIADQLAVLSENPPQNRAIDSYADWLQSFIDTVSKKIEKATGSKTGEKRSFMQKAGSFLTGKGFNEEITKEDIQKIVQEELQVVTKGN